MDKEQFPFIEERYRDKQWLYNKYHDDRLSLSEISDVCGVCSKTIQKWMDKFDIERRSLSDANSLMAKKRWGTEEKKYTDPNWLKEKYIHEGLDQEEIGEICNCSQRTISLWLEEYDIETRSHIPEVKLGEENHNWRGGVDRHWRDESRYRRLRDDIVERDNSQCVLCGDTESLEVHHITPVHAGGDKYDPLNLATLCHDHHAETHRALNY